MPVFSLAETSTQGILPPIDSTNKSIFVNSLFIFSGSAFGKSILFNTTIIGNSAILIAVIASLV